jgi:hypothetical protein
MSGGGLQQFFTRHRFLKDHPPADPPNTAPAKLHMFLSKDSQINSRD